MPEAITPATASPTPTGSPVPATTHQSTASEHHEVDLSGAKPTPISAVEKLGLKGKGTIQGPKEALGSAATSQSVVKQDLKRLRERHAPKITIPRADVKPAPKPGERERDTTGKFVPKEPAASPTEKPTPEGATKPSESKPEIAVPAAKVKIGDDEKTPEEWQSELKVLREKAEAAAKPMDKKEPAQLTEKEQQAQTAQEQQQREERRTAFIKKMSDSMTDIDEKQMDVILSGGAPAVEAMKAIRARDIMATREWMAEQFNHHMKALENRLNPVWEQQNEIASYRSESEFLGKFPDIKENPKGIEEARQVRHAMSSYYDQCQQKIAQGTASQQERADAERYEHATPEQFNESVAAYTRERLGINVTKPAVAAAPTASTKPFEPPTKPQPKPPGGQPPSGGAAPQAMSEQGMHIARMRAAAGR